MGGSRNPSRAHCAFVCAGGSWSGTAAALPFLATLGGGAVSGQRVGDVESASVLSSIVVIPGFVEVALVDGFVAFIQLGSLATQ